MEERKPIRYKNYSISLTGEYPVVNRVTKRKEGKSAGEEIHTPLYFPRDIKGAFEILERVTNTDSTRECKDLKEVLNALNENHKKLISTLNDFVKKGDL
jgi:hypothetical protein